MSLEKGLTDLALELSETEFGGELKWEPNRRWSGILVQVAETGENYFYKNRERIFVQPKQGPIRDRIPYCYACGTQAQVVILRIPLHEDGPFAGSGNVTSELSFYCETCDGKPPLNMAGGVMDIRIGA